MGGGHVLVGLISWHMDRQHPLGKLFMWDTPWYRYIAANGYDAKGGFAHFFPFTPMITAAVTTVTGLPVTIALFGVCWVGALVFGALVHRIVIRETADRAAARRAAWLTQLAPGAYALVMGYTEPLAEYSPRATSSRSALTRPGGPHLDRDHPRLSERHRAARPASCSLSRAWSRACARLAPPR